MLFSKVSIKMRKTPRIIYRAAHKPGKEDGFCSIKSVQQGFEVEANFLSGPHTPQVSGEFKRNVYLIYLSKGANSIFRPMGTMTRGIPDMAICLPPWRASRVGIKWGRKETVSNFEKDIQRRVWEKGKDIMTDKPPEAIQGVTQRGHPIIQRVFANSLCSVCGFLPQPQNSRKMGAHSFLRPLTW